MEEKSVDPGKKLVYAKADKLAVAGVLEPIEQPMEHAEKEEVEDAFVILKELGSILLAVEYGSLILVYEGLEMPAPIGRLPPLGEYILSTRCQPERMARISDDELLEMWANLILGQTEKAFSSLPRGCLPLVYPPGSCLSYTPLFDCQSYVKVRPSPTGRKIKLPPYLKGSGVNV